MAVIQAKPTSAGRRFVVKVKTDELYKGDPYEPLLARKARTGGRNNKGRITMRHRGGGHKQRYRIVDFKRAKDGIPAKVERIEYDPNRSAHIALLLYADGERRYIIAPRGVAKGDKLMSGRGAAIRPGNCLLLSDIPVGSTVHCVEFKPGKGAQIARSAGASVQLAAREGSFATLRLRSGELRKVPVVCRATIGEVGNPEHSLRSLGKGGRDALARTPANRARCCNESRRSSARGRRRPVFRWSASGDALGGADEGTQDAAEQENLNDDRSSQE